MTASRTEPQSGINGLSQVPISQSPTKSIEALPEDAKPVSAEVKEPNVIVFWDYDSTPIPSNVSVDDAVFALNEFAKAQSKGAIQIKAFTNVANIKNDSMKGLIKNHVEIVPVITDRHRAGRSEDVDKQMINQMAPANRKKDDICILVTGDAGFMPYMVALWQNRHTIKLIYPKQARAEFVKNQHWSEVIEWDKFLQTPEKPKAVVEPSHAICSHYSKNICRFGGAECKFLHICSLCGSKQHGAVRCPQNPTPPPCCAHFVKGNCRWGRECQLEHKCPDCGAKGEYRCLKCAGIAQGMQIGRGSLAPTPKHCSESFFCQAGLACNHMHYPPELECFRNNGGKGILKVRTDECKYHEQCPRRSVCTYAHNKSEYVCMYCAARGDHLGRSCPKRPRDKELLAQQQSGRGAPIPKGSGTSQAKSKPPTPAKKPKSKPSYTAKAQTEPAVIQETGPDEISSDLDSQPGSIQQIAHEKKEADDAERLSQATRAQAVLKDEPSKVKDEINAAKKQNAKDASPNTDQVKKSEITSKEQASLIKEIAESKIEKAKLHEKLEGIKQELKSLKDENETEKTKNTELNENLKTLMKELESLRNEKGKNKDKIAELNEKCEAVLKELASLRNEKQAVQAQNAELSKELAAAKLEIERLKKQIEGDKMTAMGEKLDHVARQNDLLLHQLFLFTNNKSSSPDKKDGPVPAVNASAPVTIPAKRMQFLRANAPAFELGGQNPLQNRGNS